MDNPRGSVLADKAARAAGRVHRSSEAAEPSHRNESTPNDSAGEGSSSRSGSGSGSAVRRKPPPYSGPTTPSQRPLATTSGPQYYPGLPLLDYRKYLPPLFELSSDKTTIMSKASYLCEDAAALASQIRGLAAVPPKPHIFIQGKRGRRVDFSVQMNLMTLLIPEDPSKRVDYLRCMAPGEMAQRGGQQPGLTPDLGPDAGVEDWCDVFVKDPTSIKSFAVERTVANLDTNWIEGQLRSLVAAMEYKGVVTVKFPVTHARIVVQSPDKHNKFFTSVVSLFSSKSKYEVVKIVWPFATAANGEHGRQCAVQSEAKWWDEWKDIIRFAIATKRHGWITNEDKLEYIMEGIGKESRRVDWGPEDDS